MSSIYLVVYPYSNDSVMTYCNTREDAEKFIRVYREVYGKDSCFLGIREMPPPDPQIFENETAYKDKIHAQRREQIRKAREDEYQRRLKKYGKDNADFLATFWNRIDKFHLAFRWIDPDFHLKQCAILSSLRDDVARYLEITGEDTTEYLDTCLDE